MFLFFLAVSAGFWFMTVLNETTEKEIAVPVQLYGIPNNIVITEPLPDTIRRQGQKQFGLRASSIVHELYRPSP